MYSISRKIFQLVSTLFGLKTTHNLYEFKYPTSNFFQISTIKLFIYSFTILLLDCCKMNSKPIQWHNKDRLKGRLFFKIFVSHILAVFVLNTKYL